MLSKYFVPYSTTWLLDSPYLTKLNNTLPTHKHFECVFDDNFNLNHNLYILHSNKEDRLCGDGESDKKNCEGHFLGRWPFFRRARSSAPIFLLTGIHAVSSG